MLDCGRILRRCLFTVALCLMLLCSCAIADTDVFAGVVTAPADFTYTVENDRCTITQYNGKASIVVVPAEIDGHPVLSIAASAFKNKDTLTAVKFSEGITTIGQEAFYDCDALTTVRFADSITTLGAQAFTKCDKLTDANYPIGWTTVDGSNSPFYNTSVWTELTIPYGVTCIPQLAFENIHSLVSIDIPATVTQIGNAAFRNTGLTQLDLSHLAGLTKLGSYTLQDCHALTEITLPAGLKEIGSYAMQYCRSLTVLDIPDSVHTIGEGAFQGCTSLTTFGWPAGWTTAGYKSNLDTMFHSCPNLKNVVIPEGATTIPAHVFEYSSVETVTLPSTLRTIGDYAFQGVTTLKSITTPAGLTSIGIYAFAECSALETVDLSASMQLKSIPGQAFHNVGAVKELLLPNSLESIGKSNFGGCQLTSLVLPPNLVSIGEGSFGNCKKLTELLIGEKLTTIGSRVFENCTGLTDVHIPNRNMAPAGGFAGCTNMTIWCYSNSQAHTWADNNNVPHQLYDDHAHQFVQVPEREATCLDSGVTLNKCSICGYSQVVEIQPALGHIMPSDFTQESKVSCDTDGVWTKRCERPACYAVLEQKREPMTGHQWGSWAMVRPATIYSPGREERVCSKCGKVSWQLIDQLPLPDHLKATHSTALFTVLDAATGNPLSNATLEISLEDTDVVFSTADNGQVRQLLPVGEHRVTVWAKGMRSRTVNISITNDGSGGCTIPPIGLSATELVDAKLSVHEMSLDEIKNAGIDLGDDSNQQVFQYELELEFSAEIDALSLFYYKKGDGEFIPGKGRGDRWASVGNGMQYIPEDPNQDAITLYPVSEEFYLIVYGDICWLKEMFDVELLVFNGSMTDTLTEVYATLSLPDGLSLAATTGDPQQTSIPLGSIGYGQSKSAHWYVRGDKEGDYSLTAVLDAVLAPHGETLHRAYSADENIHVYAGSALELTWHLPDAAFAREDYTIRAELKNVSSRTLYRVGHVLSNLTKAQVFHYHDGVVKESAYVAEGTLASSFAETFAPGDKLVLELSIPVENDSEIIQQQIAGYQAAVRQAEKLYATLPLLETEAGMVDALSDFLKDLVDMKAAVIMDGGVKLRSLESALQRAQILQQSTAEQQQTLNAFDALCNVLAALPVRYDMVDQHLNILSTDGANITVKVNTVPVSSEPWLVNIESYMTQFFNAILGQKLEVEGGVLPSEFTSDFLENLRDSMAYAKATDYLAMVDQQVQTLLAYTPGNVEVKVWSEKGTLDVSAIDAETRTENGKLIVEGSSYIQFTSNGQNDTLYVELDGTVHTIQVDVAQAHTCRGEWAVVHYATEHTNGYEILLCSTCGAVMDARVTTSCGDHSFPSDKTKTRSTSLTVQTRVCSKDTCHVLEYAVVDASGAQQRLITFDPNGGLGAMSPMAAPLDGVCTLPACSYTGPEGYYFLCWNTQADGQGESYVSGDAFPVTGHSTLYAVWQQGGTLEYDMSQVRLAQDMFLYDGTEHTVSLTGLPEGVSILSMEGGHGTDIGEYTLRVEFSAGDPFHKTPVLPEMTWSICCALSWQGETQRVYDGLAELPGSFQSLAEGEVTLRYARITEDFALLPLDGAPSAAGAYRVTASVPVGKTDYVQQLSQDYTILPRAAQITADHVEHTYDGQWASGTTCTAAGLLPGHTLASVEITGQAQQPGHYPGLLLPCNARIVDATGADVTACYQITYLPGDLRITSRIQVHQFTLRKGHLATVRSVRLGHVQANPAGRSTFVNCTIQALTLHYTDAPAEGEGIRLTGATRVAHVTLDATHAAGCSQTLLILEDKASVALLEITGDPGSFDPKWISSVDGTVEQVKLTQTGQTLPYAEWLATLP